MKAPATILLNPKKIRSVERYHPWIFSGAVAGIEGAPEDGDFVAVKSTDGRALGHGFYTPGASIAIRMTHFGHDFPLPRWWHERLTKAFDLRHSLGLTTGDKTNIYRLVHGEGDQMPGLIIDHYNGVLVVQAHTLGMYRRLDQITQSLGEIYGDDLKAIYNKSAETLHNGDVADGFLYGELKGKHLAKENGIEFQIDFEQGQKTGFFIDQRESRALLETFAHGRKVLNTFSYTAGFSVYALRADAELVHSLDSSQRALDLGDGNVALNGFNTDRHLSIKDDAVQHMKELGHRYDLIVLDPPAFAKHQKARHRAIQGYKRINQLAIEQIAPGGIIFTFSCSQAVDQQMFTNTVISAAIEAGRSVRILHRLHQPADHPVNAFHSEGEYLKGLVLEVGA